MIDGKFHKVEWMQDLVRSLSQKGIKNIMDKIEQLETNLPKSVTDARKYTVKQVAAMTHKNRLVAFACMCVVVFSPSDVVRYKKEDLLVSFRLIFNICYRLQPDRLTFFSSRNCKLNK